jgi:hypothetical protein
MAVRQSFVADGLIETDQSRRDHSARRSRPSVTLHVIPLAGLLRATTARRCRTLSRMSSVSSAARLKLEIGCHPIQVRNHRAQAVALATNRADLLLLLAQPLGSPAHR